jgi:CzcA family heavy metal efflux pump
MSVATFATRNSRAITLAVVLLTAAGIYSMFSLPSNIYPEVEFQRITIVAHSGDLSPRMMMLSVTRPLEEAARTVLGVRRVWSKTIRGACEISIVFNSDANMPYSLQLMQAKVDEIKADLPAATELQVERMTPSLFPIFSVDFTGRIAPVDLRDIAYFEIRPLLSRIPGVANVEVLASEERELSVVVDPERMNAAKVTIDQVEQALKDTNQVNSVGRLPKNYLQYLVLATGELTSVDDITRVVVAFHGQTPVYVGDVADVREGVIDKTTLITAGVAGTRGEAGEPAALVNVSRQIGGNILSVVDGVLAALRDFRTHLPSAVRYDIVYDLAAFVRSAVANVRDAIVIGALLAVFVLLGFLRNWRVTFVAATSLPLTMVGTFFILHLAGGTINLMSMGGLAVAIGLVIDDAIVIVENIFRHRSSGQSPDEAAVTGTNELVAAVVGSTLTTVVVFVPLGLLRGVAGQFFSALSLTLASAVLLSLFYALLFIPNATRWVLAGHEIAERERRPGWLAARYRALLAGALRRPVLVIAGTVVFAALGVLFLLNLDQGFLPEMDEGGFVIDYKTPEGTSLPETDRMLRGIERIVKATPEVAAFSRRTGSELGLFATPQNSGDILVKLKDASQRSRTALEVISDLREKFGAELPDMQIEFVQLLQDMLGDLEGNPEPIELKIFGDDLNVLNDIAERVASRLEKGEIKGVVDVVKPMRGNPELDVQVDPTRSAKAGLTVAQVSQQLSSGLLGAVATSVRRGDRIIDVRVRYPDRDRFDPDFVRNFPVTSASGAILPVSSLADVSTAQGQTEMFREDLKQMIPVTARLEGRGLGKVVPELRAMMERERLPLGYSYVIGGLYQSQVESFNSLLLVLSIAVLLVFGVLVAQFRRFTASLIIMSAAPLSLVGAFGLLYITGTPLNVSSFMGVILLIGLIVKNGIILVDYRDLLVERGVEPFDALVEAAGVRLRPILMTTLCTLFGLLPLALGLGAGAELQKPLAIAVIGGLSVSTLITLIFVPTLLLVTGGRQKPVEA